MKKNFIGKKVTLLLSLILLAGVAFFSSCSDDIGSVSGTTTDLIEGAINEENVIKPLIIKELTDQEAQAIKEGKMAPPLPAQTRATPEGVYGEGKYVYLIFNTAISEPTSGEHGYMWVTYDNDYSNNDYSNNDFQIDISKPTPYQPDTNYYLAFKGRSGFKFGHLYSIFPYGSEYASHRSCDLGMTDLAVNEYYITSSGSYQHKNSYHFDYSYIGFPYAYPDEYYPTSKMEFTIEY